MSDSNVVYIRIIGQSILFHIFHLLCIVFVFVSVLYDVFVYLRSRAS